jgi:hypothetical protein
MEQRSLGHCHFVEPRFKTHRELGPRLISDGHHTETTDDYKSDLAAEAGTKKKIKCHLTFWDCTNWLDLSHLLRNGVPKLRPVRRLGEITDNVYQNGAILILSQPGSAMQRRNLKMQKQGFEIQRVGSQSRITIRRPSGYKELCSMEGGTCSTALSQW